MDTSPSRLGPQCCRERASENDISRSVGVLVASPAEPLAVGEMQQRLEVATVHRDGRLTAGTKEGGASEVPLWLLGRPSVQED